MNFGSITDRRRRGFTLLEVLIALAISSAFLSGVYYAFIQVVRTQDAAGAREEAYRNGRAAITSMSDEIKQINKLGSNVLLVGLDGALGYGDGIDNDADGKIDEDLVDGIDNDNDWSLAKDQHAIFGNTTERPFGVGKPDLGDLGVDEDSIFGQDSLLFRLYPTVATPTVGVKTVTYAVATFDGQPNTLVRQTRIDRPGQEPIVGIAPIAFGVLGFDVLYWNPNTVPSLQYWVTTWDSSDAATFFPPQLPLPATLYVRLTLYADSKPAATYQPGKPVQTVTLESMVNIEATIKDAFFPRAKL